jgi:hypoxanthine phosphoribosyltransferase
MSNTQHNFTGPGFWSLAAGGGGDYGHTMRDDIERILIDEAVIEKRLDSMAHEIERDFPAGPMVVIILLKGALVFAADLLRRVPRPLEIECLNVASYHGGLESSGKVDFLDRHFPEVKGQHVLLLDDILDTGRTLHAVSLRLLEEGAVAVHAAVLLAKDKKRAEEVKADYVGFEIGNEFVVGYGLDYKGKYRNLPYVGVLKMSAAS